MVLKRLTWVLCGVALVLGLGIVTWEMANPPQKEETVKLPPKARHFDFSADAVQSIIITQGNQTVKLYRSASQKDGKTWQMDNPDPVAVSGPGVDFLLSIVLGSQNDRDFEVANDRDFEVAAEELKDYGLDPALAELTIQLVNGKTHRLKLGNADFKGDALYALIDPIENSDIPIETRKISLVPRSLEDLARRSPEDWKQQSGVNPENDNLGE
jgi:tagatose-1,6-bisphosphate aldolase non-catalytic subunit AgaZ/GatZ